MPYVSNLYVVAAICGNFQWESTINPGVWERLEPNSPGYGLGQWTDDATIGLTRRTDLFNYLEANGYSHDSGIGQLKFFIKENSWVPNGAGYPSLYSSLTEFLNSTSNDLRELTFEFFHHWEGIDDGTGNARLEFAEDIYDHLNNFTGERKPWYKGNFYLTPEQALSNSVLVMDFLMGTSPYSSNGKHMPVWLMYLITKGEI